MRTARAERRALAKLAHQVLRERAGWAKGPGHCLLRAWAVCAAGARMGRRLQLFAGSAHWVFQREPEVQTFGYEWTGQVVVPGALPEIHVWAGDPATGEFIDLAAGDWPAQAKAMGFGPWTAPRPPACLWTMHDALPTGADYRPTLEAGRFARDRLVELAEKSRSLSEIGSSSINRI